MGIVNRQRAAALVCVVAILLQFPIATIPVAKDVQLDSLTDFDFALLPVAVAGFNTKNAIPQYLLEGALLPGAFARDLWNKVQCEHNSAAQHLCGKKPILVTGESLLTSSDPMYQPKVIMRSMTRTFRDWKDIAQAGCSITSAAALMSLIIPAKIGFFGYVMVLYTSWNAGLTLTPFAWAFLAVLLVATDVLSVLKKKGPVRGRAGTASTAPAAAKKAQ